MTHPRSPVPEPLQLPQVGEGGVGEYLVPGHHVGLAHLSPGHTPRLHHGGLRPELLGTLHDLLVLLSAMITQDKMLAAGA